MREAAPPSQRQFGTFAQTAFSWASSPATMLFA
jgi:hypothetical protein